MPAAQGFFALLCTMPVGFCFTLKTAQRAPTFGFPYIARRPGAERFGTNGLFTDVNIPIDLNSVAEEVAEHKGILMTEVLSIRREDAARLGFDKGEVWRDMLRSQTTAMAQAMNIPLEDLRWYAAFHAVVGKGTINYCDTLYITEWKLCNSIIGIASNPILPVYANTRFSICSVSSLGACTIAMICSSVSLSIISLYFIAFSSVAETTLQLKKAAQPHIQVPTIYAGKHLQNRLRVMPAPFLLRVQTEVRMQFFETHRRRD